MHTSAKGQWWILRLIALAILIGAACTLIQANNSSFDPPVNMQCEEIVHPILRVARNQELQDLQKLDIDTLAELNNYEGPAWIQPFKTSFANAEMTAVRKLCKMAIGLERKKLVRIAGIPKFATYGYDDQDAMTSYKMQAAKKNTVTWYSTFGLNAIPVKFVLERNTCTKAYVSDWWPGLTKIQMSDYAQIKANYHPILHLQPKQVFYNDDGPLIRSLYRFPPQKENVAWTNMPVQTQTPQKLGQKRFDDSIFLKLNRYSPPNTRGSWEYLFGPKETAAAITLSFRVRGLTKNEIVSLAGPPSFRCAKVPCWKFGKEGQDIWIYQIGGSDIPVRLAFKEQVCTSSEIFSDEEFRKFEDWRVSEFKNFAVGKSLSEILAKLEKPIKFNPNVEDNTAISKLLGAESFTYSPEDTSKPLVLTFILGRCWDVRPSQDLIAR